MLSWFQNISMTNDDPWNQPILSKGVVGSSQQLIHICIMSHNLDIYTVFISKHINDKWWSMVSANSVQGSSRLLPATYICMISHHLDTYIVLISQYVNDKWWSISGNSVQGRRWPHPATWGGGISHNLDSYLKLWFQNISMTNDGLGC